VNAATRPPSGSATAANRSISARPGWTTKRMSPPARSPKGSVLNTRTPHSDRTGAGAPHDIKPRGPECPSKRPHLRPQ
jgi:hypothetical protein